ncbi:hypothetical protein XENORESO_020752 [Xenotaenia resolanae]|uniref:Uncharacterized protein n=1 Tax=Xenotaenia resolanae TaxID=208358 RepID=A0ABV0WUS4_9TELE
MNMTFSGLVGMIPSDVAIEQCLFPTCWRQTVISKLLPSVDSALVISFITSSRLKSVEEKNKEIQLEKQSVNEELSMLTEKIFTIHSLCVAIFHINRIYLV